MLAGAAAAAAGFVFVSAAVNNASSCACRRIVSAAAVGVSGRDGSGVTDAGVAGVAREEAESAPAPTTWSVSSGPYPERPRRCCCCFSDACGSGVIGERAAEAAESAAGEGEEITGGSGLVDRCEASPLLAMLTLPLALGVTANETLC